MGRIFELRAKVKDGTATETEKAELEELEAEATETTEEETEGEETTEEEQGKSIVQLGKKLADVALAELKKSMAADSNKGKITPNEADKDELPKGKERVKQFFIALFDNDRTKLDHLSGGTNADGGFLVPEEYASQFVEDRRDAVVMRMAGATQVNVVSDTFNIPQLSTRPRAYLAAELAVKSSTSASWTNISLTPYTLAAYMTASNQVVADAKIGGNLIDVITRLLTRAIAEREDELFFTGTGTAQPSGINSYTLTSFSAAGSLDYDDLIRAYHTLAQGYRRNAAWFMNVRTLIVVRQLKDSQNRPILLESVNQSEFPTILGRPVYEVNSLETSSIFFGDPSGYWIGDREGVSVRVSDEATVGGQSAFERNFTIVRIEERVDGELADTRSFIEITSTGVS